ncbi:MAG: hypothetical protein J1E63_07915 [Muribaculaceae bacterium]|nr:hypothetical protein [Muribaculaceae bacterium]
MEQEKQTVKSPEGVKELINELWRRHLNGEPRPANNIYWVEFPPPTEEELAACKLNEGVNNCKQDGED